MISHGFSLEDLYNTQLNVLKDCFDEDGSNDIEDLMETGRNTILYSIGITGGMIFASREEFLDTEFRDSSYMEGLLSRMPESRKMNELYRKYTGA